MSPRETRAALGQRHLNRRALMKAAGSRVGGCGDVVSSQLSGRGKNTTDHRLGTDPYIAATQFPIHRTYLRRVQIVAATPHAEIRDNTVSADILPIEPVGAQTVVFRACPLDPRSDRGAIQNVPQRRPFPHETAEMEFAAGPIAQLVRGGRSVICSLNEIEGPRTHAARAVAEHGGLPKRGGQAVRWLVIMGPPGLAWLSELFARNDGKPFPTSRCRTRKEGISLRVDGLALPDYCRRVICDQADDLKTERNYNWGDVRGAPSAWPPLLRPPDLPGSAVALEGRGQP